MVEVAQGQSGDGFPVPLRLHNLLLALAGRLDDSALSEARELNARARLDEAAELVAGTLIAGRIPVDAGEQRELALTLEMSRSDSMLADQLLVGDPGAGPAHQFTGDNQPEAGVSEALDRTLHVLPDLRAVHAVWRNTPAGSVPGPLPQRVVLVEIGPEGNPPAVAYRVDSALRRAGIRSVVEVAGPGAHGSGYHQAAMTVAKPVWLASGSASGSGSGSGSGSAKSGSAATPAPVPAGASAGGARSSSGGAGRHTADSEEPAPVQKPVAAKDVPPSTATIPVARRKEGKASGQAKDKDKDTEALAKPPVAGPPTRAENTADLSSAEVAQLRRALAEDPAKGRAIASAKLGPGEVVEIPDLDLDDPQLSDRDRQLLRELHAELAERERAEAAKIRLNGSGRAPGGRGWSDGFSSA
jgi:hypothetical protein